MTTLPIHIEIWGKEGGLIKVTINPAEKFGYTEHGKVFPETSAWIDAYLKGEKAPMPPLNLADLSPFMVEVIKALGLVPRGKTISYAEIARRLGKPHAARAVGRACGSNPFPLFIPCHRVISSDGQLGGYAFGLDIKDLLLKIELTQF